MNLKYNEEEKCSHEELSREIVTYTSEHWKKVDGKFKQVDESYSETIVKDFLCDNCQWDFTIEDIESFNKKESN